MSKDNLKRNYTLLDKIQLGWFLFRSKLINKNIRLIRFPFILRGKSYIDFGKILQQDFGVGLRYSPRMMMQEFG